MLRLYIHTELFTDYRGERGRGKQFAQLVYIQNVGYRGEGGAGGGGPFCWRGRATIRRLVFRPPYTPHHSPRNWRLDGPRGTSSSLS